MKGVANMTKKVISWFTTFFLLFLLTSCGIWNNKPEDAETPPEETEVIDEETEVEVVEDIDGVSQNLSDWLPRLDNVIYNYEGFGNEFASFNWTPQFNQENYYQLAKDNSGTTVVDIYEYTDEEVVHVFSRPETYFRDNFTKIGTTEKYKVNEVILKRPIVVGTNWTTDDASYEITAVDKEISVPAGDYTTIEVTIDYEDFMIKRYYAENVGLIYEWTETEGLEVESKLSDIQTEVAEEIPLTVYQTDNEIIGLDQISAEISLNTNDPARLALQELLTGETDGFENIALLPQETKINYLFLNDEGIVEVDLSREYITNMNVGSAGESFYLIGLGNTLSQYYGVDKVLLTIDGENYEGGHIILNDNEYLTFDEEMVNE